MCSQLLLPGTYRDAVRDTDGDSHPNPRRTIADALAHPDAWGELLCITR